MILFYFFKVLQYVEEKVHMIDTEKELFLWFSWGSLFGKIKIVFMVSE